MNYGDVSLSARQRQKIIPKDKGCERLHEVTHSVVSQHLSTVTVERG